MFDNILLYYFEPPSLKTHIFIHMRLAQFLNGQPTIWVRDFIAPFLMKGLCLAHLDGWPLLGFAVAATVCCMQRVVIKFKICTHLPDI